MQLLWSKAVQTRSSCRCASCLRSATATARRATSAATRGRLKLGDVFTACYSSMLATAALADAKVKDNRRKEWDRAIAEARAGTAIKSHNSVQGEQVVSNSGSSEVVVSPRCETYTQSSHFNVIWNPSYWLSTQAIPLESRFLQIDKELRNPDGCRKRVPKQEGASFESYRNPDLEGEWIDEAPIKGVPFREPKSTVHLQKINSVVGKLVGQLLLQTTVFTSLSFGEASRTSRLSKEMRDMARRLDLLQHGFNQVPSYLRQDPRTMKERRSELHRMIRSACKSQSAERSNNDLIVARICYNILVSSTPPSVVTYNILIHELSQMGEYGMAQVVIDSFFNDTKFAPSSKTICLLLDHYLAMGDKIGFQSVIRRMNGVADDMHVKKKNLEFLRDPKVLAWALSGKVIHRSGMLISKIPRDSNMFDSLIHGSLRLIGVGAASRYLRAALRECQKVREETLCAVVSTCLARLEYSSAEVLLLGILTWWRDGNGHALFHFSKKVRFVLHQLLRVCGIDSLPTSDQAVSEFSIQRQLHGLLMHMKLESLKEKIERHTQCIASLRSTLHLDLSVSGQKPSSENVDRALEILVSERRSGRNRKRFQQWHEKHAKDIKRRVATAKKIEPEVLQPRSVLRQLVAREPAQSVNDEETEDVGCTSRLTADETPNFEELPSTLVDGAVPSSASSIKWSDRPREDDPGFEHEFSTKTIPQLSYLSCVPCTGGSSYLSSVQSSNGTTKGSQLGNVHFSSRVHVHNRWEHRLAL